MIPGVSHLLSAVFFEFEFLLAVAFAALLGLAVVGFLYLLYKALYPRKKPPEALVITGKTVRSGPSQEDRTSARGEGATQAESHSEETAEVVADSSTTGGGTAKSAGHQTNKPSTGPEDQISYEYEQERWNMPGFLSMHPVSAPESLLAPDFDSYFRGSGTRPQQSLDALHTFSFRELPKDIHVLSDVEVYCKEFLNETEEWYPESKSTLFLLSNRQSFRPVLERRGNLFVSGDAIESDVTPEVSTRIMGGSPVMDDTGHVIYFPLLSNVQVLGILRIESDSPRYSEHRMSHAWVGIKRFSAFLYQARLFEQVTRDLQTTLYNGLQFQRDLGELRHFNEYLHAPLFLLLIRFHWEKISDAGPSGLALRPFFSAGRLYRIASDVFAVSAPYVSMEDLQHRLIGYREYLNRFQLDYGSCGGAILRFDVQSDRQWFSRARLALEEASRIKEPTLVFDEGRQAGIQYVSLTLDPRSTGVS